MKAYSEGNTRFFYTDIDVNCFNLSKVYRKNNKF